MIYVTGDLHGEFSDLINFSNSIKGKALNKQDYVIVLGDFGLWPETVNQIKKLSEILNFTLLFLEGNHEDYRLLESFPKKTLFGGTVRDVYGVYQLCRSEIFLIPTATEKIKIAVCGGGDSRDKLQRIEGIDWFPAEKISEYDVNALIEKVKKHKMEVDFFISHSMSAAVLNEWNYELSQNSFFGKSHIKITESDYRIRDIITKLKAKEYLSAHEHFDRTFHLAGKRYRSVYKEFVKLA